MEGTFVDMSKRLRERLGLLEELLQGERSEPRPRPEANMPAAPDKEPSAVERGQALWEEMEEDVENLDYALMFCQVGGLQVLFQYLLRAAAGEQDAQARTWAVRVLTVLATLTQNNPPVQAEVLAYAMQDAGGGGQDVVALLSRLFLREVGLEEASSVAVGSGERHGRLQAKLLHALSCTVRGHADAEARFVQSYAPEVFRAGLQPSRQERVQVKALFFLQALLGADDATPARGGALLPLLPLVVPCLENNENVDLRHTAACVVTGLANLTGGPAVIFGKDGGVALRRAMERQQGLLGSGSDEAMEEELLFWNALARGGTGKMSWRDGEGIGQEREGVEGVGGGGGLALQSLQSGASESATADQTNEAPAPVLLLGQPQYLSGASSAP
jgi:hypothetical protein